MVGYKIRREDEVKSIFDVPTNPDAPTMSVPIAYLSHCTHTEEAKKITTENGYIFIPKEKVAKLESVKYDPTSGGSDPSPVSELNGAIFPGKLSWWGINPQQWYENDPQKQYLKDKLKKLEKCQDHEVIYVPVYLQARPNSHYGNFSFTCSIDTILRKYTSSRSECASGSVDVYFRKAGTLRYRNEVCYVVFVCTGNDLDEDGIKKMPPLNDAKSEAFQVFKHNGFLDEEGKVVGTVGEDIDWQEVPRFVSRYPVRAVYHDINKNSFYSWDNLSFAFYFPKDSADHFSFNKKDIIKDKVRHLASYCHLEVCPNPGRI